LSIEAPLALDSRLKLNETTAANTPEEMQCDDTFRLDLDRLGPELKLWTNRAVKHEMLRVGMKRTHGRVMTDLLADDAIAEVLPGRHTHFSYRYR